MEKRSNKRQEALINKLLTVFIIACVFAFAILSFGKAGDVKSYIFATSVMPWAILATAVIASLFIYLSFGQKKKLGKKAYLEKTYTFGYIGGLFISLLVFEILYYFLQGSPYISSVSTLLLVLLCMALISYVALIVYKFDFFCYTVGSCIAFAEILVLRIYKCSIKCLIAEAVLNILLFALIIVLNKCGKKLFKKKLLTDRFMRYAMIVLLILPIAAFPLVSQFYIYLMVFFAVQYFAYVIISAVK